MPDYVSANALLLVEFIWVLDFCLFICQLQNVTFEGYDILAVVEEIGGEEGGSGCHCGRG